MPLSWNEIRARATTFAADWKGTTSEDADAKPFWDAYFEVFGISRRKVASFEKRVHKLGTAQSKIDLRWKGTLLIEHKSLGRDLGRAYKQAIDYFPGLKPEELPRYVLICDFAHFELHDLEPDAGAKAVHKFKLSELPRNIQRLKKSGKWMTRVDDTYVEFNRPANDQMHQASLGSLPGILWPSVAISRGPREWL